MGGRGGGGGWSVSFYNCGYVELNCCVIKFMFVDVEVLLIG